MSRHARKDGGNYRKADACVAGQPPFIYKISFQYVPVGSGYPECFAVLDQGGKTIAWLTDKQMRDALDRFDEMA